MSTADGRWTITFNGEIYNFHDVRLSLESLGHTFHSRSDTEVILAAWQQWGAESLRRLRGMFAFAIWDRDSARLWLARDRMGEKPLYYAAQNGRFLFASEVRTLLASGAVARRLDSDGLDAYLTFGSVADPHTLVEGVQALEAGHWMKIDASGITSQAYWSLSDIEERSSRRSRDENVEEAGALLRESCNRCMVSDVPVAVLLSGGVDSSSNVVVLSEQGHCNLQTFSVLFEGPDIRFSEQKWSDFVAARFDTRHQRVVVSEERAREQVRDAVEAMDQPSCDGVNTYLVCRAIAEAGIKVAVTGQGADELFLGYSQRHQFKRLLHLAKLRVPGVGPLVRRLGGMTALRDSRYEKLLQTVGSKSAVASAYLAQHSIFSQAGMERLRGGRRPAQTRFIRNQGGSTPLGMLSRLDLSHYLRNTLLRDADQMSMANSLEMRAPFVDYRLVETLSSLSADERIEPRDRQKPLLVDAVGPALPAEVADRPKQGFGLPYDRWLRGGLEVADVCETDVGLDPSAIASVKEAFLRGRYWTRYWTLQVLVAWARRHRMLPPR